MRKNINIIIIIIKHRSPPSAGFSATTPDAGASDAGYSNASASDANYSNAGTSEAVKACNRGLAHVQKKCIVLVLYNNYVRHAFMHVHALMTMQ